MNSPGGHWTVISITFVLSTTVSYHDSIDSMKYHFEQYKNPLLKFLTKLGCNNISFNFFQTGQQEDGCSCGIFAIAGIITHIHNLAQLTLNKKDISCLRKDFFHSILLNKLFIHSPMMFSTTLKRKSTYLHAPKSKYPKKDIRKASLVLTDLHYGCKDIIVSSANQRKRNHSTQKLITDTFKLIDQSLNDDSIELPSNKDIPLISIQPSSEKTMNKKRKLTKKL